MLPSSSAKTPQQSNNAPADKAFNTFLLVSFILSILLPIIYYSVSLYSLSTGPRSMHLSVKSAFDSRLFLFFICGPVSFYAALTFLVSSIVSVLKKKNDRLKLFLSSLSWFFCLFLFFNFSGKIRDHRQKAFADLAIRSKKVISAIEKYKSDHGEYPEKMRNLIPLHLPDVPYTGLPLYPDYEYEISPKEDWHPMKYYELRVQCPSGGINWDVFFYWPDGNYPDNIYGGYVERIGDWAYVHE